MQAQLRSQWAGISSTRSRSQQPTRRDVCANVNSQNLRKGDLVLYDDYPHEVMERWSVKPGKGGAFIKAKIRKVGTGQSAFEVSWRSGENVEEADVEKNSLEFSYVDEEQIVMYDENYEEVRVPYRKEWAELMVPGTRYQFKYFQGEVVAMQIPGQVTMQVVEVDALTAASGDRSKMANKAAKLESGLTIQVPEYIAEGDYVKYNVTTGEFMKRVEPGEES